MKLPTNLVVAPETNNTDLLRSLLAAFDKAGIGKLENGHLCYNDSDMGLSYDGFVKDCTMLRFHKELSEIYNVLHVNGFKF